MHVDIDKAGHAHLAAHIAHFIAFCGLDGWRNLDDARTLYLDVAYRVEIDLRVDRTNVFKH